MTRPLVVTSVFVGGHSDGHGHHMVAGQMAQEVYKAAGDPKMFPDQIREGLRPWTPLKVYSRAPFRLTEKTILDYADGHTYPLQFYNYIEDRCRTRTEAGSEIYMIPRESMTLCLAIHFSKLGARDSATKSRKMEVPAILLRRPSKPPIIAGVLGSPRKTRNRRFLTALMFLSPESPHWLRKATLLF